MHLSHSVSAAPCSHDLELFEPDLPGAELLDRRERSGDRTVACRMRFLDRPIVVGHMYDRLRWAPSAAHVQMLQLEHTRRVLHRAIEIDSEQVLVVNHLLAICEQDEQLVSLVQLRGRQVVTQLHVATHQGMAPRVLAEHQPRAPGPHHLRGHDLVRARVF